MRKKNEVQSKMMISLNWLNQKRSSNLCLQLDELDSECPLKIANLNKLLLPELKLEKAIFS